MKNTIKKYLLRNVFKKFSRSAANEIKIPADDNISAPEIRKNIFRSAQKIINSISVSNYEMQPGTDEHNSIPAGNVKQKAGEDRKNPFPVIETEPDENGYIASFPSGSNVTEDNLYHVNPGREIINAIASLNKNEADLKQTNPINKSSALVLSGNVDVEDDLKAKSIVIDSFVRTGSRAFRSMWKELINGGKEAKEPWDALWLSFSKTALKSIGDIISSLMISGLPGKTKGDASPGALLSSIASLFLAGPAGAAIAASQSLLGKSSPLNESMPQSFMSSDTHSLISAFNKYAEAAEKWQREIKVVNDVFENNRAIKTVQEYLAKIKS